MIQNNAVHCAYAVFLFFMMHPDYGMIGDIVIHNILPCNEMLHKWTIKQDNKCDLCDKVQTIRHLLFGCVFVKEVWVLVERNLDLELVHCILNMNLISD